MMTRLPGQSAGTSRAAPPPAANPRAASSRAAGRHAAGPCAVWTGAALAAAVVLIAGCGSLAASSGRAQSAAAASAHPRTTEPTAGAGGAGQPGQPAAARAVLCRHLLAPLSVQIVRLGGPVNTPQGAGGGAGTGGGAESVRVTNTKALSVAEAACALPVLPPGSPHCPLGTPQDHEYRLTFTIPGRVLPVVTVHDDGCQQVTGLGPVRWMLPDREPFLAELGRISTGWRPGEPVKLPLTGKPIRRLRSIAGRT